MKHNHSSSLRYTIVLQPDPEGGFTVTVPALPGCITYGKNLREAKDMAADAIAGYLASMAKHHEPLPTQEESFITSISLRRIPTRGAKVYA